MEIPKQLKDDIWDYCRVNNITNIDEFTVKLIRQGFTVEKYGTEPVIPKKINKTPETSSDEIELINLDLSENIKNHIDFVKETKDKIEVEVRTLNKEISKRDQKNDKDLYGE